MQRSDYWVRSDRELRHGAVCRRPRRIRPNQRGNRPRQPLTWDQRQALIPAFEADIRLLERITGESFVDWLAPRGDSGGLVGARPSGQSQARNGKPRAY